MQTGAAGVQTGAAGMQTGADAVQVGADGAGRSPSGAGAGGELAQEQSLWLSNLVHQQALETERLGPYPYPCP